MTWIFSRCVQQLRKVLVRPKKNMQSGSGSPRRQSCSLSNLAKRSFVTHQATVLRIVDPYLSLFLSLFFFPFSNWKVYSNTWYLNYCDLHKCVLHSDVGVLFILLQFRKCCKWMDVYRSSVDCDRNRFVCLAIKYRQGSTFMVASESCAIHYRFVVAKLDGRTTLLCQRI